MKHKFSIVCPVPDFGIVTTWYKRRAFALQTLRLRIRSMLLPMFLPRVELASEGVTGLVRSWEFAVLIEIFPSRRRGFRIKM